MASTKVTVEKAYLDTLLRKAQFHTDGVDYSVTDRVPTVTITKFEYDSLLRASREYVNLQRSLFQGGITPAALTVLVNDDIGTDQNGGTTVYSAVDDPVASDTFFPQALHSATPGTIGTKQDCTYGRNANYTPRSGNEQSYGSNGYNGTDGYINGINHSHNDDYSSLPDGLDGSYDGSPNNDSQPRSKRQKYEKFAKRTILLSNLPEGATHAEITQVVRGGMLLDVYVRSNDRNASVSFLEESAAQDFFRFVKRHDLYIRGKRVNIRWNERQFILPGHVANKISIGATRNLVILNYNAKHTEEVIRDDLEHIHNLIVIKVEFRGPNCYISTNSVHNSMFARTCMMSRATYKGAKIDWDVDECAAPLERPLKAQETVPVNKKKKDNAPLKNRFELLKLDDQEEDDSEEDDEDFDHSGISLPSEVFVSPSRLRR